MATGRNSMCTAHAAHASTAIPMSQRLAMGSPHPAKDGESSHAATVSTLTTANAQTDACQGRFADAHIESFSDAELNAYERLLEALEADLLAWVTGAAAVPAEYDTAMFRRLCDFHFRAGR